MPSTSSKEFFWIHALAGQMLSLPFAKQLENVWGQVTVNHTTHTHEQWDNCCSGFCFLNKVRIGSQCAFDLMSDDNEDAFQFNVIGVTGDCKLFTQATFLRAKRETQKVGAHL